MKPYSPPNNKGRHVAGHDVHHKTRDSGPSWARAKAKALRKAARRNPK